jgi:hypothetical protein
MPPTAWSVLGLAVSVYFRCFLTVVYENPGESWGGYFLHSYRVESVYLAACAPQTVCGNGELSAAGCLPV